MAAADSTYSSFQNPGDTQLLDGGDNQIIDRVLVDLVSGGTVTKFDSGVLIVGDGAGGEKQGALIPGQGQLEGTFINGNLSLIVDIPAGTGLVFNGNDNQPFDDSQIYLQNQVKSYFQVDTPTNYQVSVTNAVDDLLIGYRGKDISYRVFDFIGKNINRKSFLHDDITTTDGDGTINANNANTFAILDSDGAYQGVDSLVGANEILLDAGNSPGVQVFALALGNTYGQTVVLKNVDGAVLAGAGSVRAEGDTAIRITSDNTAHNVTGGDGADTLIGSGNDTLTGGVGSDVFGFNIGGKYTVTDFNKLADKLAFDVTGITTVGQLAAKVTSVVKTADAITYNFGPDNSITLVGVSASDLTASMLQFNFTS